MRNSALHNKEEIQNMFPQLFERYKFPDSKPIARESGFGAVWRAQDTWIDQTVAIKISYSDLSDEVKFCRIIGGQTVRVYEYFKSESLHAFSMELLEKPWCTIEDLIKKRKNKENRLQHYLDSLFIARSVLRALSEIHGLPYSRNGRHVHGDVHPRNIFIRRQKNNDNPISEFNGGRNLVKIIDLGLTVRRGDILPGRHPNYADPRCRKAKPGCDLYALGVVILELVTGVRPSHKQMKNGTRIRKHVRKYSSGSFYIDCKTAEFINELARASRDKSKTVAKIIKYLNRHILNQPQDLILSLLAMRKDVKNPCFSMQLVKILFPVYANIYNWKNKNGKRLRFIRRQIADMVDIGILHTKKSKVSLEEIK
jgi:serine/threonine protein kinase